MKYAVHLMASAEEDLYHLQNYIAEAESRETAEAVAAQLESLSQSLDEFPERGHITPELKAMDIIDYREVHYQSYRVIYRVDGQDVFIYAILDGRRDLKTVLHERLVR